MPVPLRIATFNLENLDDKPGAEPALAARIPVLRRRLGRLDADVLCLQEINAQRGPDKRAPRRLAALDALLAGTPYAGFACVASAHRDGHGPLDVQNLAILSRLPIAWHRQYWHELVPPIDYRPATAVPGAGTPQAVEWDRPALHAAIEAAPGRIVHVFNLHLRAPLAAAIAGQKESAFVWRTAAGWAEGFFVAAVKRAGQALETRLAVDRVFDREPEALIVVCGDMNAEEREMPLRILRADAGDTGAPALAARALVPLERMVAAAKRYSVVHAGRAAMLDHVLASPALFALCRSVEVHNEALEDEAYAELRAPANPASYHAPVVAEFVI